MPRRTPVAVAAVIAVALTVVTTWTAGAQIPPIGGEPASPPTTEPPPPEHAPSQPTPGPSAPTDAGNAGGGSGDGGAAPSDATRIPPEYEALMRSVRRTRPNNTRALVAELAQLEAFGVTHDQALAAGMGRFPVAGVASFVDDWWFPRFTPGFHLHVGTDIFAAYGTPVRAPVDGRVRITNGRIGGLAVYVAMPDRTYFYMAHLSGLAADLHDGQQVRTGDIVGYVGDSGNARGGAPHVHFEIHPRGGPPINPKPYLDKFIADARAQVPRFVAYYRQLAEQRAAASTATPTVAAPAVTPPPSPAAPLGVTIRPAASPLLWVTSMGATVGALGLAEHDLVDAARSIDWSARAFDDDARGLVRLLLAPLTPRLFAGALVT
jgi:murein DD-endopeptidase MepM/ murein hydrolase activator NlpD